jgi:Ca2+-binding RTX toxin-like protein
MRLTPVAVLSAAMLLVPAAANAQSQNGVSAQIDNGTLEVSGGNGSNSAALRLKQGDATVIQVDAGNDGSADFSFTRADVRSIDVEMGNGNDLVRIDDSNGSFTNTIPTTISGGNGNDTLIGGQGAETFYGGNGDDSVVGGKGNDTAFLGRGDDSFRWEPGDGSDVIEGESGTDTMVFDGAAVNDTVTLSANGRRLRFFRQPANITMDTAGVEIVDFNALGGQDNVTVGDLSGTDVRQTNIDLASSLGGSAADGALDTVNVTGTDGDDNIAVTGNGSGADVTGLASAVSVTHADPTDVLSVNTGAGSDNVAVAGVTGLLQLLVDGVPSA